MSAVIHGSIIAFGVGHDSRVLDSIQKNHSVILRVREPLLQEALQYCNSFVFAHAIPTRDR